MKPVTLTLTALAATALSVLSVVLIRSATMPGCSAKVGEICVVTDGMRFEGLQRSSQIESERYVLAFRDPAGKAHELTVVRDGSLGEALPDTGGGTARIETRLWNGSRSSVYVVGGPVPGVTVNICVESWLGPQCARSGTLTRLTPYRG